MRIPHFWTVSLCAVKHGFAILIHHQSTEVKSGNGKSSNVEKKFGNKNRPVKSWWSYFGIRRGWFTSMWFQIRKSMAKSFGSIAVFPDDFLKNPYRLKKFRTFFRHGYQIKGFCKYYWNKPYISQSDYVEPFYEH